MNRARRDELWSEMEPFTVKNQGIKTIFFILILVVFVFSILALDDYDEDSYYIAILSLSVIVFVTYLIYWLFLKKSGSTYLGELLSMAVCFTAVFNIVITGYYIGEPGRSNELVDDDLLSHKELSILTFIFSFLMFFSMLMRYIMSFVKPQTMCTP